MTTLARATNYYVKNGGNNAFTGLSDAQAWETIAKVSGFAFSAGDTIFFKRGSIWRINASDGYLELKSGSAAGDVVYTSYSTGNAPLICGSKEENAGGDWADQGGNLWRNSDASFTVEIGNLIFNGNSTGKRELVYGNVNAQGDFYYDYANDRITLYSVGNPATFYTDIECVFKVTPGLLYIAGTSNYITVDSLDIRYGGRHALIASSGADHITIRHCNVEYMGGVETSEGSGTRLGNGIEFYNAASDILVEYNLVKECFDAAITSQGDGASVVDNIKIRNNIFMKSEYCLEFWHFNVGSAVSNFYFENNTLCNAGEGWGHNQRDSPHGNCIALFGFTATKNNVFIRNNIFYKATEDLFYSSGTAYSGMTIDYNDYYLTAGNYGEQSAINYATLALWKAAISQESHAIDGDPVFVTPVTNLNLQVTSPCIDVALGIGLVYDYAGNIRDATPDIGAYEYNGTPPTPPPKMPAITTDFTYQWAKGVKCGGSSIDDGGGTITARGVCYSTSINPTTADSKISGGTGINDFTVKIIGLAVSTTYHIRAYCTNAEGTAYGADYEFTTSAKNYMPSGSKIVTSGGKPVKID
jgi:hypothetical protein